MFQKIYKEVKKTYEKDFQVEKNLRERYFIIIGTFIGSGIVITSLIKSGEFSLDNFWSSVITIFVLGLFFFTIYNMAEGIDVMRSKKTVEIFKKILKKEGFYAKKIEENFEGILKKEGSYAKKRVIFLKNIGGNNLVIKQTLSYVLGEIKFNSDTFFEDFSIKKNKIFYIRQFFSDFFIYFLGFIVLFSRSPFGEDTFFKNNIIGISIIFCFLVIILWVIIPILFKFLRNSEFYKNNYSKKYDYFPSIYEKQNLPLEYVKILEKVFEMEKSFGKKIFIQISENSLHIKIEQKHKVSFLYFISGKKYYKDFYYREYALFIMLIRYLEDLNLKLQDFYYINKKIGVNK